MNKLKIIGLEGSAGTVVLEVQFNPKEITIDKSVHWQQQKTSGPADLEFSAGQPMTMDIELMFDGFPSGTSIQGEIDKLQLFSDRDAALKRPPRVKVIWGNDGAPGTLPQFQSVIEALDIRYTMFDPNGLPLRATVRVRFKQARNIKVAAPSRARQGSPRA